MTVKIFKVVYFEFEHVDGSGVPGAMSLSSLVSEKCPGQEQCGPDVGYATGKHPSYTLQKIRQARMNCNWKIAAMEVRVGTQNAITFYI